MLAVALIAVVYMTETDADTIFIKTKQLFPYNF